MGTVGKKRGRSIPKKKLPDTTSRYQQEGHVGLASEGAELKSPEHEIGRGRLCWFGTFSLNTESNTLAKTPRESVKLAGKNKGPH